MLVETSRPPEPRFRTAARRTVPPGAPTSPQATLQHEVLRSGVAHFLEHLELFFLFLGPVGTLQGRAGDWGAGADGIGRRGNVGKRHEEGGDLNRLWRTRRQTTQGRRRGGGADAQGETREGAGRCGDQQEDGTKRLGAAGTRGTMWKTVRVL